MVHYWSAGIPARCSEVWSSDYLEPEPSGRGGRKDSLVPETRREVVDLPYRPLALGEVGTHGRGWIRDPRRTLKGGQSFPPRSVSAVLTRTWLGKPCRTAVGDGRFAVEKRGWGRRCVGEGKDVWSKAGKKRNGREKKVAIIGVGCGAG